MNKQEQDLDTGNWYWTDEYVESLEAENAYIKTLNQLLVEANKPGQLRKLYKAINALAKALEVKDD